MENEIQELITIEDGKALVSQFASQQLAMVEMQIKEMIEFRDSYKKKILEEMENKGIMKIESDDLTITYKGEYETNKFDVTRFKIENPELYEEYLEPSTTKPSVTIKVKCK